ncbi:hypothetical protein K461DRAFT_321657 [Myriangium duriaei CBS 260.36]|uniref:RRM domain-containing protein n=1 Tax=Myriangium duriaei CBS 260.36 TaxID=1168546 RepID=A0A9P4J3B1_9PEZI|nr:hypothetical protein K461DRAFT_321657 [Myriangium duriaei CBS 260.36]
MSQKVPGRTVFVGNIPYGVSEEQIIDIFSRVGAVNNFRLVHDKETGRPKGFGFLEYTDTDTAAAAVRNLNDHDIMGRKLRVDWSNDSNSNPQQGGDNSHVATNGPDAHDAAAALPSLPAGTDAPPGLTAPDAISQTLSGMPAPQLLDLISQMKGMVAENPAGATHLFTIAPQFAYAIFQALLLLGLTDVSILSSIIQTASAQPQQQQQQQPPQYSQPQAPPPNPYAGYPQYQQQAAVPTPPIQQQAYQPPQPPAPQAQPDQAALIQQLMQMSAEQIFALPAAQRDQIIQLRAQLGAPVT